MAALMDGKALAAEVREQLGAEVQRLPVPPGLHVILVGPKSDAKAYMQPLKKLCRQVGVEAASTELHDNCSENELRTAIMQANEDPTVHGVLLQLPLPKHMDERAVTQLIAPEKDVDCVHPLSMGKLLLRGYEPAAWPSVAAGCLALLERSNVELRGKRATVIGRSNLVGMPTALMLQQRGATVTICHSDTPICDVKAATLGSDIVVVAVGKPDFVKSTWIKSGAAVCDIGLTTIEDADAPGGYRMVGDCDDTVKEVAGLITPVPGGVAALTVAMTLRNVVRLAKSASEAVKVPSLPSAPEAVDEVAVGAETSETGEPEE
jgi:5,10-methylene-tetrahydrofolate dehydrogenase/methenyl tetrahydrofolate cyclohydrolase